MKTECPMTSAATLRKTLPAVLISAALAGLPLAANAGIMRNYDEELAVSVKHVRDGVLKQAVTHLEKNNEDNDKDILYFFEKGELFSLGNNYLASRDIWMKGDEIIQAWENEFRTNPSKLFGDIGSYLISDKTRRYDGQDYEKVMLSTRLTLTHIMLGHFDNARIEMKKTYEREKLIESFREKEYDALAAENEKEGNGEIKKLDGYPMAEIDTPEVRELKNGFQNAFAHYLAGYFFEVTNESSLAEPGYRNALQLAPNSRMILRALENIGREPLPEGQSEVLFVIETGFAPSIDSLNIPIPIPRKRGTIVTPLSFPVVTSSPKVLVPPTIKLVDQALPVETLTNIDTMARRMIRDQMPGTILRTVIRAGFKSLVQDQAEKAHWLAGLIAKVASVATEQADDRNWRMLPERISIARGRLPHGRRSIEFQTNAGSYRTEVDIAGAFTIVPIRLTGGAVYVGLAQRAPQGANALAELTVQPSGEGLAEPVASAAPSPAAAASVPLTLLRASPSSTPTATAPTRAPAPGAEPTPATDTAPPTPPAPAAIQTASAGTYSIAPTAAPTAAALGKRVSVGDTTYIGDFRFEQPSGLPAGQGRVEWRNGDSYEGTLAGGLRTGKGSFVSKDGGFRYEGDWRDNAQNGRGKTTFDDGDVYEGDMVGGLFHGQGTYRSKDGWRYEGEWKNGVKDGQGRLTYADGGRWEGRFAEDRQTADGQMIFNTTPVAEARPAETPTAAPKAAPEAASAPAQEEDDEDE
ncbi:hypothetical protein [Propionivibrio dicarboxylicus]|uniref:MORN repeat-containing protein n=1 Tax=Propionivibrio dicarboxylicus TaxID=83767 RepID=A0A1G8E5E7_9RHOO|nr:hypothetical protein [Propionivibrio dicarboxylicus]SDH65084.1 hypothetical protein SAMN05660652_02033 [Propionivibrio dicarboxylicus]